MNLKNPTASDLIALKAMVSKDPKAMVPGVGSHTELFLRPGKANPAAPRLVVKHGVVKDGNHPFAIMAAFIQKGAALHSLKVFGLN